MTDLPQVDWRRMYRKLEAWVEADECGAWVASSLPLSAIACF